MADQGELTFDPQKFSGRVRLFPLPDLVMFPHVMQPLHVFEPRYRDLVAASLSDDHLLALAVLAPGWEGNYDGRPAIAPVACLSKIVTCRQLPDGRYNLFALGLSRIEIIRELPPEKSYREAEVRLLDDLTPAAAAGARSALAEQLIAAFKQLLPKISGNLEQFEQLLSGELPLGVLTDLVGFALGLPHEAKHKLLAETSVDRRAQMLLAQLADMANRQTGSSFPPQFSAN